MVVDVVWIAILVVLCLMPHHALPAAQLLGTGLHYTTSWKKISEFNEQYCTQMASEVIGRGFLNAPSLIMGKDWQGKSVNSCLILILLLFIVAVS